MANRDNHYEAAFEAFLRARAMPYVAVDEARRSLVDEGDSIKSLDFIVSEPGGARWLIDVKGRRFPSGDHQPQYWKNWSTRDDVTSLSRWERLFGGNFCGLFLFAYEVVGRRAPLPVEQLFLFRERLYAFLAVPLRVYAALARPLSAAWDTVALSTSDFRRWARPFPDPAAQRMPAPAAAPPMPACTPPLPADPATAAGVIGPGRR